MSVENIRRRLSHRYIEFLEVVPTFGVCISITLFCSIEFLKETAYEHAEFVNLLSYLFYNRNSVLIYDARNRTSIQ